jgi:VanZ family protein
VLLFAPTVGDDGGVPYADKLVHVLIFVGLTLAAGWRFGRGPAVLGALVAYAVGSEVAQGLFLPGRSGNPLDVVADLVGIALAWAVLGRVLRGGRARAD